MRLELAVASIVLLPAVAVGQAVSPAQTTRIDDVVLVSPERARPLEDGWVLLEGDRIADVGRGPGRPGAETVIDGRGRYLVPGLIDGHVHLEGVPGFGFPIAPDLRPIVDAYYEQLPRSYLYFGFTTVVDLNVLSRPFIDAVKAAPIGPDVFDCDGALALANGYPMVFFPPESRFETHPNFLYDPRQAEEFPARYSAEDHSPAAVVERVASHGGICVKTHHEDGFGPESVWPTPTEAMIAAVVAEAHRRDLTVAMHANSYPAYRFAVDAGVDVIVHGMWNWDGLGDKGVALPDEIVAVADRLIEGGIAFMPTLRVLGGMRSMFDPGFLVDPRLGRVLPAAVVEWYATEKGQWFVAELRAEFDGLPDDAIRARMGTAIDQGGRVAKYLVDHGGTLVFGSDTPSSPTYGNPPGYNGFLELRALAELGISAARLLRAATIDVARVYGLDALYGTIEPGKIANLLLLAEDPLASVEAYDAIDLVIVRGRIVERGALAADAVP